MSLENRGILIKKSGDGALYFDFFGVDYSVSPPAKVSTGTADLYLLHVTPGGEPWEIFNWSTNVFEVPADGTDADHHIAMTHQTIGSSVVYNTGWWFHRLVNLDDFEDGHQYKLVIEHSAIGPHAAFFQYGSPPVEGLWYNAGAYTMTCTLTLADLITACPQVIYQIFNLTGTLQASGLTDDEGKFWPQLDPGTYNVYFGPDSRYSFTTPYTLVVAAQGETHSFTCTETVYPTQGMTFAELKAHVRFALAELNAAAGYRELDEELLETWVRQAHYIVDAALEWTKERVTMNAVADQRYYTLDATVRDIRALAYNGYELMRLTLQEEITRHELDDTTGVPSRWAWWGQELSLYPTPSASATSAIMLWALKTPPALVEETERPTVPPQSHTLIVQYALMLAFQHLGDVERAVATKQLFDRGVSDEQHRIHALHGGNTAVRRDGRVM